jgi:hypothetical protein
MHYPPPPPPPGYQPPSFGTASTGTPQSWEVGEVISSAFEAFKLSWGPLVAGVFISGLIRQVPTILIQVGFGMMGISDETGGAGVHVSASPALVVLGVGISLFGLLAALALYSFFNVGLIRMYCAAARNEPIDLGVLFRGLDRLLPMVGVQLLFGLAVGLGLLFFIVPGIILSLGLLFAPYYVADAGLGPVEAIKASWAATTGERGKVFLFGVAACGVSLLGLLACCLGIYAAVPVISIATAIIYTRISGSSGSSGGMGAPPFPGPGFAGYPGGGYGPPPGGGYGPPPGGGYGPPPGGGYG